MAKFEDELIARLKFGEDIASVRQWFLEQMAEDKDGKYADLTPFERWFFDNLVFSYQVGCQQQQEKSSQLSDENRSIQ